MDDREEFYAEIYRKIILRSFSLEPQGKILLCLNSSLLIPWSPRPVLAQTKGLYNEGFNKILYRKV